MLLRTLSTTVLLLSAAAIAAEGPVPSDLLRRGYTVIPLPQKVALGDRDVIFDGSWSIQYGQIPRTHIAARQLVGDLRDLHQLALAGTGTKAITLSIQPGTVAVPGDPELKPQGYRLRISADRVEAIGNGDAGLFYAVQTLLQLLKPGPRGTLLLPIGTIDDWPSLQLRFLHWDTKNHQDRMETLRRYLDWTARFKANVIGFEFGDRFEFPSLKDVGIPGAFTTAEIQELTAYARERFIEIVPVIQAPSHLAYVLKHPQYAHLKADGNNYQACLCDEDTYKLIFALYDDVIRATPGSKHIFVSTDEIYYANAGDKCPKPDNPEQRSLRWAEFAKRARDYVHGKGRTMLAWLEYPLLASHMSLIPPDVIDGVIGEEDYLPIQKQKNMRQLGYVSTQGAEMLFPDHLPADLDLRDPQAQGDDDPLEFERGHSTGRISDLYHSIAHGRFRRGNPIGVFGAAWDDSGLHNETFWLGWSAVASYGWNPAGPSPEEHTAQFMRIYYGPETAGMVEIYRGIQRQARAWQRTWDHVVSRTRGPGYGNSDGKGIGTTRYDHTLNPPALPALPALEVKTSFSRDYRKYLAQAQRRSAENSQLQHAILDNMLRASRNRYNLEVLSALARFTDHHWNLLIGLSEIERTLDAAKAASAKNRPADALRSLAAAHDRAVALEAEGEQTFRNLVSTFEISMQPKGRSFQGRDYLQVLDDTKDHWAARTANLDFMQAPERSIGLAKWRADLTKIIEGYAATNSLKLPKLREAPIVQ